MKTKIINQKKSFKKLEEDKFFRNKFIENIKKNKKNIKKQKKDKILLNKNNEKIKKQEKNKILLGFHASGKTTFIAALWHNLYHEIKKDAPYTFEPPPDRSYLEKIQKNWINCQEVEHTPILEYQKIKLNFKRNFKINKLNKLINNQKTFSLLDVSGDLFLKCWVDRQWYDNLDDYVKKANGIILFINPLNQIYNNTINEVYEVFYDVFLKEEGYPFDIDSWFEDIDIPWEVPDWDANDSPSQVKLVELLQLFLEKCSPNCRITILVSAWDIMRAYDISPELWIGRKLPLLMQFLISNFSDKKNFAFFGISAQGADYKTCNLRELKHKDPFDRVIVVKEKNEPSNIFELLQWIAEE